MTTRDEITAVLDAYAAALRSRDVDAAAACFTHDATVSAPQVPTAQGSGVRDLYGQIFSALDLDISFEVDDVLEEGERAAVFTRSSGTQTTVAGGEESPEANREAFVFVQQEGDWKIQRYLFNTVA